MNKNLLIGLSVAGLVVAGAFGFLGAKLAMNSTANNGGDFAGGVSPTPLFTGNAAGGYIIPVGSLGLATQNGLFVGGGSQYNEQSVYETASGTPLAAGATLGALGTTSSTATTSITLANSTGLLTGAICSGGAATTTVYISGCVLTATNNVTGTAIVAYSNITGGAITVPSTTVFRITFDQLPY